MAITAPNPIPVRCLGPVEEELLGRLARLRLVGRQAPGGGGSFQGVDEVQV